MVRPPAAGAAGRGLLAALLPALGLALWQLVATLSRAPAWLLPGPGQVAVAAWQGRAGLLAAAAVTGQEGLVGFLLAAGLGMAGGLALFRLSLLRQAVYPWLVVSQTVPILSLAPLLAVWLGFGLAPKVIVVFLMSFFPVVVTTLDGLAQADRDLVRLMRAFGLGEGAILWRVRLPSALPAIFSGLRMAGAFAVVGAVVSEWTGSDAGLGYAILRTSSQFQTAATFAAVAVASLMGIVLFALVSLAERWLVPWRRPEAPPVPLAPIWKGGSDRRVESPLP